MLTTTSAQGRRCAHLGSCVCGGRRSPPRLIRLPSVQRGSAALKAYSPWSAASKVPPLVQVKENGAHRTIRSMRKCDYTPVSDEQSLAHRSASRSGPVGRRPSRARVQALDASYIQHSEWRHPAEMMFDLLGAHRTDGQTGAPTDGLFEWCRPSGLLPPTPCSARLAVLRRQPIPSSDVADVRRRPAGPAIAHGDCPARRALAISGAIRAAPSSSLAIRGLRWCGLSASSIAGPPFSGTCHGPPLAQARQHRRGRTGKLTAGISAMRGVNKTIHAGASALTGTSAGAASTRAAPSASRRP